MKYLFHNIYGDANDLISTKPDDVILVPYGWDENTEMKRNEILAQLNLSGISGLPCYVFQHPAYKELIPERVNKEFNLDENGNIIYDENGYPTFTNNETIIPADIISLPEGYLEVPIFRLEKPWSWEEITRKESEILQNIANLTEEANNYLQI